MLSSPLVASPIAQAASRRLRALAFGVRQTQAIIGDPCGLNPLKEGIRESKLPIPKEVSKVTLGINVDRTESWRVNDFSKLIPEYVLWPANSSSIKYEIKL